MARISYAMYLFHYSVLYSIFGGIVTPFYFSLESLVNTQNEILSNNPNYVTPLTSTAKSATAEKPAAASPQKEYIVV
ncbi:hypothetical protein MSG28_006230 [Choristoneura fumiferana]|uniref:Uncharacterized protein n=1 Tax=Choristoneura fumiferana TaxID=7141 RepID=A0ACC0JEB1_CHOFU|nr:hypothetical protein MSG28_006230 [Choristoneura fumiferana]